jgi:hypothetical protein
VIGIRASFVFRTGDSVWSCFLVFLWRGPGHRNPGKTRGAMGTGGVAWRLVVGHLRSLVTRNSLTTQLLATAFSIDHGPSAGSGLKSKVFKGVARERHDSIRTLDFRPDPTSLPGELSYERSNMGGLSPRVHLASELSLVTAARNRVAKRTVIRRPRETQVWLLTAESAPLIPIFQSPAW